MIGMLVADPYVAGVIENSNDLWLRGFDEQGPTLMEGFSKVPRVAQQAGLAIANQHRCMIDELDSGDLRRCADFMLFGHPYVLNAHV